MAGKAGPSLPAALKGLGPAELETKIGEMVQGWPEPRACGTMTRSFLFFTGYSVPV